MSWEDIVKRLEPQDKMHAFAFRTSVNFDDATTYGFTNVGDAIVEWEFAFGQREQNMREIGVYVTKVTLPDGTELEEDDIDKINNDDVDIYGKLSPADLIKYNDEYELVWSY